MQVSIELPKQYVVTAAEMWSDIDPPSLDRRGPGPTKYAGGHIKVISSLVIGPNGLYKYHHFLRVAMTQIMIEINNIASCGRKGIDFIHTHFLSSRGENYKVYIRKNKFKKCIASMKLHNLD